MPIRLVHKLFYTWAGWPSVPPLPPEPEASFFETLRDAWRRDHFELQTHTWKPDQIQLAFRVEPDVSPVFFSTRVKGRLQHALRQAPAPVAFSRKVGMRAVGENVSGDVEDYLRKQTIRADLADERYRATLRKLSFENPADDLSAPSETNSGRYWYNLHLVAVTAGRYRIGREDFLPKIRLAALAWATETKCLLKSLALMPDHLHIAVRGPIEMSPLALAESLWTKLNHAAGCQLISDQVYAGTFSEYSVRVLS